MGPKRRCHVCKERIEGPSFKFPTIEAKRTMWVKSLEIDEPKKFGSKGPSICSEHFDRKSLKRTLKGGWRLSEGAKPLHIVSSRTGFEENMYLVSNRGKVTIDIRENLWQKLIFCNNRKNSFRHRMFIIFCTMHIKFWYLQERNKRLTDAWLSWAIGCWEMSFTTHKTSTKLAQWSLMM